jgi:hypothetical protein
MVSLDEALMALDYAHVAVCDGAGELERGVRADPADLHAYIRDARKALLDALRSLDEAQAYADYARSVSP